MLEQLNDVSGTLFRYGVSDSIAYMQASHCFSLVTPSGELLKTSRLTNNRQFQKGSRACDDVVREQLLELLLVVGVVLA